MNTKAVAFGGDRKTPDINRRYETSSVKGEADFPPAEESIDRLFPIFAKAPSTPSGEEGHGAHSVSHGRGETYISDFATNFNVMAENSLPPLHGITPLQPPHSGSNVNHATAVTNKVIVRPGAKRFPACLAGLWGRSWHLAFGARKRQPNIDQ